MGSSAGELIPELVRYGLQQLIELEVAAVLGAERHERSDDRLGYRNGYRPQGRLKVCPRSSWRGCQHWLWSVGLTAPNARNSLCCSRSARTG